MTAGMQKAQERKHMHFILTQIGSPDILWHSVVIAAGWLAVYGLWCPQPGYSIELTPLHIGMRHRRERIKFYF
jgi:hypothetical protein